MSGRDRIAQAVLEPGEAQWRRERRGRIVASALRLFSDHPYETVQMDDVARLAGVAKPTLYRYFGSKEELFLASLEEALGELELAVEQAARGDDLRTALRAALACVLESLGRCTAAIRAFDDAEPTLGDQGRALIRRRVDAIRRTVAGLLARGCKAGLIDTPDVESAAIALIGAARMMAAKTPEAQRGKALAALWALIERGLLVDDPPNPEDD
jgi:AcrR family transcriptional regulator